MAYPIRGMDQTERESECLQVCLCLRRVRQGEGESSVWAALNGNGWVDVVYFPGKKASVMDGPSDEGREGWRSLVGRRRGVEISWMLSTLFLIIVVKHPTQSNLSERSGLIHRAFQSMARHWIITC